MLSGVVDFANDHVLAGWVRGTEPAEISVTAIVDGQRIPAGCESDGGAQPSVKFHINLPRAVATVELIDRSVIVEARTASETIVLGFWQPIEAAAMLDRMNGAMLERMLQTVSSETYDALAELFGSRPAELPQPAAELPQPAGERFDSNSFEDIMRWS